ERLRQQEWERRVHEITDLDFSAGFANPYSADQESSNIRVDSPEDGLVISLANLGKVDIAYIAKISGQTPKRVVSCLKGSIFQNPDTWNESVLEGWETSDEYLSGCIAKKLISARAANEKYFGYFSDNIVALEKAMPRMSLASEIYISLGSPWIPPKTIEAFLNHLFPDAYFSMEVEHDEAFSSWKIPHRSWAHGASFEKTWGTKKRNALYLVESALNMKTPEIRYDELDCISHPGAKKGDVWVQATMEAVEKQRLLIKEFRRWVWEDKARREELQAIYHERFGSIRTRKYDGTFLPFKGLSPEVSLYPYQKDAVARIIFSKNTLLAHDVGAGKTYVMIAAAMEMKRIGISPKNMFVVPNNVLKQWESVFKTMYPYANPLVIGPSNFTKEKRGEAMKEMKDGAYDAIIIAYSCFNQIPLSEKTLMGTIEDEISKLTDFLDQGSFASNVDRRRKALYKARQALFEAADETGIHFDDLGITRLFVDEAHNYKNLPFTTKMGNVLGLNPEGSKLCQAMYEKVRSVQKEGGVVFATGTPITNSIADIYTMQRYLQPGQLELMGLTEFDAWVGSFASVKRGFEVDVDTNSFRMASRLSEFHNLPELSSMIALLADFHTVDNQGCLPAFGGHDDVVVPQSQSLSKYLSEISRRAEAVRCHLVSRAQDNMLKITTDGRKAALDIRLVDPTLDPGLSCKLIHCADKVAAIYREHFFQHAAQLIFCDYSVPSSSWNVYDEMKRLLMDRGVFESDIAFVHDATTETK
ncbi:MAG: DEAD/DEAH box helicase family protein, partial [Bacilli bacterium]|nr:DEAD/DEAH box helicase family protein [Bacilli bacterium]